MNIELRGKIFLLLIVVLLLTIGLLVVNNKSNNQLKIDKKVKVHQFYSFKAIPRNYQHIQFGDFRKDFDKPYNRLVDELSNAYYNFWKNGRSKPCQGYDMQPTLEQSKKLFDELHGLIWHWYNVNFHQANLSRPVDKRIPEKEYNYIYGSDGKVLYKKSDFSRKIIEKYEKQGIMIEIK